MPENLCNNPDVTETEEGYTFSNPCGYFGCNEDEFLSWTGHLKQILNHSENAITNLKNLGITLTKDHLSYIDKHDSITNKFNEINNAYAENPDDLDYEAYIKQDLRIMVKDSACNLENIQRSIEEAGGKIQPTNLSGEGADYKKKQSYKPWEGWPWVFGIAGLIGGFWIFTKLAVGARKEYGEWVPIMEAREKLNIMKKRGKIPKKVGWGTKGSGSTWASSR